MHPSKINSLAEFIAYCLEDQVTPITPLRIVDIIKAYAEVEDLTDWLNKNLKEQNNAPCRG
jgi:hypothetical protein